MGYTKRYDPQRYAPILPLVRKLEELKEGEVAELSGLDREETANARWLVYDWISHVAPGGFSVKVNWAGGRIRVRKKGFRAAEVTVAREGAETLNKEILEEIILIMDQEVAERRLEEAVREGEISLRQAGELMAEWKRIME